MMTGLSLEKESKEPITILVIDDDSYICKFVKENLEQHGYQVSYVLEGKAGLEKIEKEKPDLVLLDLMLPGMDGLTVLRKIRERSRVPIIVLSALGEEETKVQALELGADDYLTKPLSVQEMTARVFAVLRRSTLKFMRPKPRKIETGDLVINPETHKVTKGGEELHLTPTEYKLLVELAQNAGKALPHAILLARIWGADHTDMGHYLYVYIGRLRRKLGTAPNGRPYIFTDPGEGYRFEMAEKELEPF